MQKSRLFEGLIIGIHLIPFGIVYDSTLLNTYDWYLYIPLVIGGILNIPLISENIQSKKSQRETSKLFDLFEVSIF
jgi:hypothetical protein